MAHSLVIGITYSASISRKRSPLDLILVVEAETAATPLESWDRKLDFSERRTKRVCPSSPQCFGTLESAAQQTKPKSLTARIYWARSKALGSEQRSWLMLPFSCSTDSYSRSSIHSRICPSIVLK